VVRGADLRGTNWQNLKNKALYNTNTNILNKTDHPEENRKTMTNIAVRGSAEEKHMFKLLVIFPRVGLFFFI